MLFKSLTSRVIILTILLLTTAIGLFTLFHLRRDQNDLIDNTRDNAELLLATIENSIFNSMMLGNSEDVQTILEMVGHSPRLLNVRIFHPDGTILRSAHPSEIGEQVGKEDFKLFESGKSADIFHSHNEEVLGVVRPIFSEQRCYPCHGRNSKVIGVLNLNFSLEDTTQKLKKASLYFMVSTVLVILLLSAGISFILVRLVRRPLKRMAEKMAQVEAGDLSVRMAPRYSDEMGSLVRSFNSMVINLEKAQKELEQCHFQQMERADRLASVGEMASGIAHEIKNPLAGISSAISVLADDFPADDPRRDVVSKVLEQISRLDKTANDLLYFGRPGKPEFKPVDVNELVQKILFFVAQHPEAKKINRYKDLGDGLPPVLADEKQMQQVLLNIIINALQAMGEGGTLRVQTDLHNCHLGKDFVRIRVTDTGKGIGPESLEKIFTPFYTTKAKGTGLGLPICRKLIKQHGGHVHVESQVGEGTVFSIELPVVGLQHKNGEEEKSA